MNKIDILLDVVEFTTPTFNDDKAKITLQLLNSGFKKFQISFKQYQNLKQKIDTKKENVFVCFGDYSYIWSDADKFNFLEDTFNASKLFSYQQFIEPHPVLLSCNSSVQQQNNIINQNIFNRNNRDYDVSVIATNELLNEELNKFNYLKLINQNYNFYNNIDDVILTQKNKSFDYQNQISKLSYLNNTFGLFLEAGLGKTKTALDTACSLLKNKLIKNVLIFSPANLMTNWQEEMEKHSYKMYHNKMLIISNKNLEKMTKNKKEIAEINSKINETVDKIELKKLNKELSELVPISEQYLNDIKEGKTLIIIDEFHNFKNPLSQKSQYLLSILEEKSRVLVLSATPFPKGFQDMFVVFKIFNILSREINYFQFKNFFFDEIKNSFGGSEKLILKKDKEYLSKLIYSRLKGKSVFLRKGDALELPEQNYNIHYYEPSEEQNAIIQNILNDTPIPEYINPNSMPFSNKELRDSLIRIMQIQGGFYLDKDENFCELEVNNKFKLLLDLLYQHNGEKIIIFCAFTAEADLITKKIVNLGFKAVCRHGKLTKKNADNAIKQFRTKEIDILVATGDSAGTGFTFIDGCTIIYYSNNFNAVTREQAEGRIHRVGQKRTCQYHDLLSVGGVDEIVFNCIKRKMFNKTEMFEKLKQLKKIKK